MNDLEIHEGGLEHRTDDIAEIPTHYWIRTKDTDSVESWEIVKASMDNIHIINDPTSFGCYEVVAIPNHPQTLHHQLQKAREEERERIIKIVNDLKQQWGGAIDLRSAEFAESETKRRIIKNIV